MTKTYEEIVALVRDTLVDAGSTFREDKKEAYKRAIGTERNEQAKWVLEQVLANAEAAEKNKSPLCDDSGIPHLVLEVGEDRAVTGRMLDAIREGVAEGLRKLPGRPMGIMGDDSNRIDQSGGLDPDSAGVAPAPRGQRDPTPCPDVRRRPGDPGEDLSCVPQAQYPGGAG